MSTFHMGTATQVRIGFELIFTSNQPSYIHAGRIILLYMTSQQSKQIYATCDYNGTSAMIEFPLGNFIRKWQETILARRCTI